MQESPVRSDGLRDLGHERDDVVLHLGFEGGNPLRVDARAPAHGLHRASRNPPLLGPRLARENLDFEPTRVARRIRPDLPHCRPCVSSDHESNPPKTPVSTASSRTFPSRTSAQLSGVNNRRAIPTICSCVTASSRVASSVVVTCRPKYISLSATRSIR